MISESDSKFLRHLRGLAIVYVVFSHVGGLWFWEPYSRFLSTGMPLFFFISGATCFYSYSRYESIPKYLRTRLVGLLLPYYLLCVVCLLFFFIQKLRMPHVDISSLLAWITITPSAKMMPFPIGQVWFLFALVVIIIVSPVVFYLHKKSILYTFLIIGFTLAVSFLQLFYDVASRFGLFGKDFYRPFFYLSLFSMGFLYFTNMTLFSSKILLYIGIFSLACSLIFIKVFQIQISYLYHMFPPDIYFAAGCVATVCIMLLLRKSFTWSLIRIPLLSKVLDFFYVHTFSVFLLHTLGIYFFEIWFDALFPVKHIWYGAIKLPIVLIITCILSIPFTYACSLIKTYLFSQERFAGSLTSTQEK
jgi:peptidoglycan/LPS O-acetylase OafA/YrhL